MAAITKSAGHIFEDSLNKDLWKVAKNYSSDKSAKVVAAAFDLFTSLVTHRAHFKSSSDYETLKNLYQKALDSSYGVARQSAARCFAAVLNLLTNSPLPQATHEKYSKAIEVDESEPNRTSSPAPNASGSSKVKLPFALSFRDGVLALASIYTSSTATTRVRVGVTQTLAIFIMNCDTQTTEANFFEISNMLLYNVLSDPNISQDRHKFILAREHAKFIITEVIGRQVLGEIGQISAIKTLINEILKNYPKVLKEQEEVPKETLIGTLECITKFLALVGSAASSLVDSLKDALLRVIVHPSYTVQVTACACFQELTSASPSLIIPLLDKSLTHIHKTFPLISDQKAPHSQVTGFALLISLLVSVTYEHPLYSSIDIASRCVSTATSFLKATGDIDAPTSALQIQVAWRLISGVMPLGHNFIKVYLSQLLILWKSSIPKVFIKDRFTDKSTIELCYLYHVKNCALGSIAAFLANNSKLLTIDVAGRIIQLLQNATHFMNAIPAKAFADEEKSHLLDKSINLTDYDYLLKRRVLQCYVYLTQYSHTLESFPANLLPLVLSLFGSPDMFNSVNMSTAIATNSGSIDSIWQMADNFAYGVTTNVNGFNIIELQQEHVIDKSKIHNSTMEPIKDVQESHWLSEFDWIDTLENQIRSPVLGAIEQDPDVLIHSLDRQQLYVGPVPATTAVANLSIELFATLFPLQQPKVQESLLVQLSSYLYSPSSSSQKSDRITAMFVNSSVAIYSLLKYVTSSNSRDRISSTKILALIKKILTPILGSSDPIVRNVAAQALGLMCSIGGLSMSAEVIKYLIDEVVQNTDPSSRAGCSVALGYILKHVGGMFAGMHLKTVFGILTSLANDPHPTVHFWALEAISITISGVGLNFANYSLSTLSNLSKLYLQTSHSDEMASVVSSNLEIQFSTYRIIARCVHALIDVMGPDIQESEKSQEIVLLLLEQFQLSNDYICIVETIKSTQELIIFAPNLIDISTFVKPLLVDLMLPYQTPVKTAAIDALYQLIRTSSHALFKYTGAELKRDIWLAYDLNPSDKALRAFIKRWVEQTAESEALEWIGGVQKILFNSKKEFKPKVETKPKEAETNLADEEVAGFAGGGDPADKSGAIDEPLKWQTRALAVESLRDIVSLNFKDKSLQEIEKTPILTKIGDIIRVAFSSATASVLQLRLLGVKLLNDILLYLQDIQDPEFNKVALLEQYQAQISSALTPAFTGDTSAELAAQAINVCATFIGIGIIKNIERMGRILKLLISSLENCADNKIVLGDLKSLSPNAQVMLRMAILSSWADLLVASTTKEYLQDVVSPYTPILVPLWLTSLREFAELRFEPEQSSSLSNSSLGGSIDHMYSALSRNSILPFYQRSWLQLVDAIATMVEKNPDEIFNILNNKDQPGNSSPNTKYGSEPAAFFFVLFGILFESLIRPQQTLGSEEEGYSSERRAQILSALKRIIHPAISGTAIYSDMVFIETIDVLDRLVLTGTVTEQLLVVDIAYRLCIYHPDKQSHSGNNSPIEAKDGSSGDNLSDRVNQLFELVRVVMLALTNLLTFLVDQPVPRSTLNNLTKPPYIALIHGALGNLVGMVEMFPTVVRVDLYACLLYVFGKILEKTELIGDVIVKVGLVQFKELIKNMVHTRQAAGTGSQYAEAIDRAISMATAQLVAVLADASATTASGRTQKELSLLGIVIVFRNAADLLGPPAGPHLVAELAQLLVECIAIPQMQIVAAEALRGLLSAAHCTPVGQALIIKTIPPLVALATGDGSSSYLAKSSAPRDSDDENDEEDLVVDHGNAISHHHHRRTSSTAADIAQRKEAAAAAARVPKLVIEVLVELTKSLDPTEEAERVRALLSVTIPVLLWFASGGNDEESSDAPEVTEERQVYVNGRLLELAGHASVEFKNVLQSGLSAWQRQMTEYIMVGGGRGASSANSASDGSAAGSGTNGSTGAAHIELKSFV